MCESFPSGQRNRRVRAGTQNKSKPNSAVQDKCGACFVCEVAKQFNRAKTEAIAEILQTLVTLGRARKIAENKFSR